MRKFTKGMLRKIQMVNKWKKCITSLKRHFHSSNEQRSETDYSTLASARDTLLQSWVPHNLWGKHLSLKQSYRQHIMLKSVQCNVIYI